MPSSIHDSSNSLEAIIPWKKLWPNSCTVTDSAAKTLSNPGRLRMGWVPRVMKVGYSIPPAPMPPRGGSTMVIVDQG